MFKRVLALTSLALISATTLMGQGLVPLVYETKDEWLVDLPAGDFGYSAQMIIVDKATGLVRSYETYDSASDGFISEPYWQTGERMDAPVSTLSLLLESYSTQLMLPKALSNRIKTYYSGGYEAEFDLGIVGVGPEAALSFPAAPDQEQYEPMVLVQSGLNSPPNAIQHELLLTGMETAYEVSLPIAMSVFERSLTFPIDPNQVFDGSNALVALISEGQVSLREPIKNGLKLLNSENFPAAGQLIYGDFLQDGYGNQLLCYALNDTNLYLYVIKEVAGDWQLTPPLAYDLGSPIQMATRLVLDGQLLVAVQYVGSNQIDLLDLADERIVDQLTMSNLSGALTGVVSMGGDRLLIFSGKGGVTDQYELFGSDGSGGLKSLFTGQVPMDGFSVDSSKQKRPNLFFFDASPLGSSNARLLGWLSAWGDIAWASEPILYPGSVTYDTWVDWGAEDGLQKSYQSSSYAGDETNSVLTNQINSSASVYALNLSGEEFSALFASWSPKPGTYDQLALIEASFPENTELYYRGSEDEAWQSYSSPFYPSGEQVSLSYYIQTASGDKSPIKTVNYNFTLSAFNRDSNGDGIPDYVQMALGGDPFGTGDSDGDAASDLDELLAKTSITDPTEMPAEDSELNRGYYETLQVVSRNLAKEPWFSGSTGYVDRLTGARLGQASVAEGSRFAVFDQVPLVYPEGVIAVSTEARYLILSEGVAEPTGFEQLKLLPLDRSELFEIDASYTGGSLSDAASEWLDELADYTAGEQTIRELSLQVDDTAFAIAMEYAFEQYFKSQAYLPSDAQLTLFPNRTGDDRWTSLSEIATLMDESNGEPEFSVDELWDGLQIEASYSSAAAVAINWVEWTYFCREVYQSYTDAQVAHITGQGPVDLLRAVLREQAVSAELLDTLGLQLDAIGPALAEGQGLAASFVYDDVQLYELTVEEANADGCFLARNAFAQQYALFDAYGERYISSKSIDLLPETQIRVYGVLRDDFTACAGSALEVRSFQIVEMPELVANDSDGNLLDDNWELFWLGEGGHDPFASVDGSGYSLLQKFLGGHNPADSSDLPAAAIEDLSAPDIRIHMSATNEVTLTWEWPGAYSDSIQFKLIQSDELGNLRSVTPTSVNYNRVGDAHTLVLGVPAGDARFFKLVMSL